MADLALDLDPPTVQFHELLGQGQAESRALLGTGVVPADLSELLEDGRLVLGRDSDPRVGDGDGEHAFGRPRGEANPAALRGELHGVGQEVQQDLLHLPLVGDHVLEPLVHGLAERDPVPGCPLPHQGQGIVQGGGQMEPIELQLEPSGLHLGQVEDVVDQGEEMPARGQDVLQVLGLLLVHLPKHPLGQDLREAEDGVQRGPELVGHVGEELGLVAAGGLQQPTLVLDLVKEPGVLDGEGRLRGEGREEPDDVRIERAWPLARDDQDADDLVLAEQRNPEQRAMPGVDQRVPDGTLVGALDGDVGDLDRLAQARHLGRQSLAPGDRGHPPGRRQDRGVPLIDVVARTKPELFPGLDVLPDLAG